MKKFAMVVADISQTQGVNSVTRQILALNAKFKKYGIQFVKLFDCNGAYLPDQIPAPAPESSAQAQARKASLKDTILYHNLFAQLFLYSYKDAGAERAAVDRFAKERDSFDGVLFQGPYCAYYFGKKYDKKQLRVATMDHAADENVLDCLFEGRPEMNVPMVRKRLYRNVASAYANSDVVLAICDKARDGMRKRYKGNFVSVVNGIKDVTENRRAQIGAAPELRLAIVARVRDRKGQFKLVQAVSGLKEDIKVKLQIVGAGEDVEKIQKYVAEHRLEDRVILRGNLCQKDVFQVLLQSDCFVLPTVMDTIPICILEAMSCGLPVISSDIGGITQLVCHGENGFIVPPEVDTLKQTLEYCADNIPLLQKMGAESRKRYERDFSDDIYVERMAQALSLLFTKK